MEQNVLLVSIICFITAASQIFCTDPCDDNVDENLRSTITQQKITPDLTHVKSIGIRPGSYFGGTYDSATLGVLREYFDLSNHHFVGASSGSLIALAAVLNIPAEGTNWFFKETIEKKRNLPCYGIGQWGEIMEGTMRETIHKFRPDIKEGEIHKHLSERLHVSITLVTLFPPSLKTVRVSKFESDDDLFKSLLASCHLPWVVNGKFLGIWRGQRCLDGGLLDIDPILNPNTTKIHPLLWRPLSFWIKCGYGCFTLHTQEEALKAIELGRKDTLNNLNHFKDNCGFTPTRELPTSERTSYDGEPLSLSSLLIKKVDTIWFFSRNILLSQASLYFSGVRSVYQKYYPGSALPIAKALTVCMLLRYGWQMLS